MNTDMIMEKDLLLEQLMPGLHMCLSIASQYLPTRTNIHQIPMDTVCDYKTKNDIIHTRKFSLLGNAFTFMAVV